MTNGPTRAFKFTVIEPEHSELAPPHEIVTVEPGGVGGDCDVVVDIDDNGTPADVVGVEIHQGAIANPPAVPTNPTLLDKHPTVQFRWEGSVHFDLPGGTISNSLPTATAIIWPGMNDPMGETQWSLPTTAFFKIHQQNA